MAKSKINKDKNKIIITENTTRSELEKIKDPKARIQAFKDYNEFHSRKVSKTEIKKESKEKNNSVGSTMRVKVPIKKEQPVGRPRVSLNPAREKLQVLVDEANARVEQLMETQARIAEENKGKKKADRVQFASRALEEAQRTLLPSHKEQYGELFTANLPRSRDINRELARVTAFLNDYTSMSQGAENFSSNVSSGLFGGQWRKLGYDGYDEENVTKEDAEMTFRIYSEVVADNGGWERVIAYFKYSNPGMIDYGSEQLINMIYDMVQNKSAFAETEELDTAGVIKARADQFVKDMISNYDKMAVLQRSGNDYGVIDPEDAEERRRRYEWRVSRMGGL